jgi:trigger factor
MQSTLEELEGNKIKLSVEVGAAEVDKAVDAAARKLAREVRMPGFRPGKVPRRVLEARMGHGALRQEALRESLPEFYASAVREHEVDVIAAPEIDITEGQEEGDLKFAAVVEIRPQVQIPGYGGLQVKLDRPEATDEDIDRQVDRLRSNGAALEEVSRPAKDGDVLTIDLGMTPADGEPNNLTDVS